MHTERQIFPAASLARLHSLALPTWLLAVLVGVVALLPRCLTLADFFTEDESFHWVWRVRHFSGFLRAHDWASTNLTGHPGVTTMWLGTFGRWLGDWRGVPLDGLAEGSAGVAYLAMLRLPLALVNSLAVVLGFLLLLYLFQRGTALLAALLWATSPFLIAHSRLLHMDALLTSFMTLSLLCLLVSGSQRLATRRTIAYLLLAASGALGGLALLTKAPAVLLLPVVALIVLLQEIGGRGWGVAWRLLLWLAGAALTFVAVWPAMWVVPLEALGALLGEISGNAAVPHHSGNYFLGQPVADPGWLFYPAVILWRTAPLTLVGLLLLPFVGRGSRLSHDERRALLALELFMLLFILALSFAPKKFDRYLLPIWPTLTILAAVGLGWLWQQLRQRAGVLARTAAGLLAAALLAGSLLWYHPYYLAYFNPLLGGSATAQQVLLVGWGEGMEHVGAWLRRRPDVARSPVLSWGPRTLEPFVPGRVTYLNMQTLQEPASYAVLYIRSRQRNESGGAEEYLRQQAAPLYTLRMYGFDYAYVYQPPRPYDEPLDAVFGEGLHLRGFSQQRLGSTLVLTPSWNVQTSQPGGLFSFVHIIGPDDQVVAQVDAPLDEGLFAEWQAGQQFGSPLPIPLPADLPPGAYRVVLGVYEPASGARLPLTHAQALPEPIDGAGVLLLTRFQQE